MPEARALSNVGKRLADKIWEIVQQGRLQMLEEFQSQDNLVARNLSTKIWGAGPATAQKWGFRSLKALAAKGNLSSQQKIGLKHFHDFLEKIPSAEAELIADTPALEVIPCGSYRRGRAMCGDVDVLITHPDGKSHEGVFCKILQILHESRDSVPVTAEVDVESPAPPRKHTSTAATMRYRVRAVYERCRQ
ncbi:DNA polymerase lambda-like [Rhipicephalus microplus]|uniref:DNA polymerase lambda-like n=1 Tax=Rhipicephalus microplus TaxID=6941 RepID=UPI003F6BCD77